MSWLGDLERRHADVFGAVEWGSWIRRINERLGLDVDDRRRFVESRWAPEFFWGPLSDFRPGEWIALVALNPREMSPHWRSWHERDVPWTADLYWRYHTRTETLDLLPDDFYDARWGRTAVLLESELRKAPELLDHPRDA